MSNRITRPILIKTGIATLIILALIVGIEVYFNYLNKYPETDDAYLQANFVKIASLIPGSVFTVNVKNNQTVKKGELLFSLDPKPYELEVTGMKAKIEFIKQKLMGAKAAISAGEQELDKAQIEVQAIKDVYERLNGLVKQGDAPKNDAVKAKARLMGANAALKAAEYKLIQAKTELGEESHKENPELKAVTAEYDGALFKLNHTRYYSPINGIVSEVKMHKGDVIGAGIPVFVLVDTSHYWINANFTENKLNKIKVGQPVQITVDMYPDLTLHGRVESISQSSGTSFSLLPQQNASGNWVKVAQRFPVQISIDHIPASKVLRVGASCSVRIDTVSNI